MIASQRIATMSDRKTAGAKSKSITLSQHNLAETQHPHWLWQMFEAYYITQRRLVTMKMKTTIQSWTTIDIVTSALMENTVARHCLTLLTIGSHSLVVSITIEEISSM
jgi:hypothetical protein